MRTCNRAKAIIATACILSAAGGSSQTAGVAEPQAGGITAPSMPSISAPTLGGGFYAPGGARAPTFPSASTRQQAAAAGTAAASPDAGSATGASASRTTELLSALTASDIQQLSNSGLLGRLGTILGADASSLTSGTELSNLYTSKSTSETNVLLQSVLTQIAEIKQQNATLQTEMQEVKAAALPQTAAESRPHHTEPRATAAKPSHLIRFAVNGYDVLRTCRTIYISDVQADGTFLVTGDRRYQSDGSTCAETFHLLFKASAATGGQGYAAAAAVTQDTFNQNSFLYQLSQRDNLQATRTGNMVSMRTTDPDWKLELLIDLGED